jgi:hypothetical protein
MGKSYLGPSSVKKEPQHPGDPGAGMARLEEQVWSESEYDLQAELNVSCGIDGCSPPEGAVAHSPVRVLQVHVVEQVEGLSPELEFCSLIVPEPRDTGVLDDVEVAVDVTWADVGIATEVPLLAQGRRRKLGCRKDAR